MHGKIRRTFKSLLLMLSMILLVLSSSHCGGPAGSDEPTPNPVGKLTVIGVSDSGILDFGETVLGTPGVKTVTLKNDGDKPIDLTASLTVGGTDAGLFTLNSQPGLSLEPGASTSFDITFDPLDGGAKTASIVIEYTVDSSNLSYTITLKGTCMAAEADLKVGEVELASGTGVDSEYDFGEVYTNASKTVAFTINNSGTAALDLGALSRSSGSSDFTIASGGSVTSLNAGESATFEIQFSPSSAAALNAVFSFSTNDNNENPYRFVVKGTGKAPAPEINVKQLDSDISDGGSFDFGSAVYSDGMEVQKTFTIENTGNMALTLGTVASNNANFVVTQPGSTTISSAGSTTFTVTFKPSATGLYSGEITIGNDDSDENPYNITVTGNATAAPEPEINVKQGTNGIASSGSYDFGNTPAGSSSTEVTFTIENTGDATLNISGASLGGTNPGEFAITASPASSVAVAGSTVVKVKFNPSSAGAKSATLTIQNDDSDEGSYVVNLSGSGTVPNVIVQGQADASTYTFSDFTIGVTDSSSTENIFTIENNGQADLTGISVSLSGTHANQFILSAPAVTSLSPGATTTFKVRFNPNTVGAKNAAVSIASNDPDGAYSFNLSGLAKAPEIKLVQGTEIASGGSKDMGSVYVDKGAASQTSMSFTIQNTGNMALSLGNITRTAGSSDFSITAQPSSSVAAGGSTTFTVQFAPTSAGNKSATFSIPNDDPDENPYTFTVTATAKYEWTIMVYLNGDNDLEPAAIQDLNEMEGVDLSGSSINVIVLLDRHASYDTSNGNWTDTRLYKVKYDSNGVDGTIISTELASSELGLTVGGAEELDMGDYQNMTKLVNYSKTHQIADQYAFIIWNHGSGWRSTNITGSQKPFQSRPSLNYTNTKTRSLSQISFNKEKVSLSGSDASNYKAVSSDETDGNIILTAQIYTALQGKGIEVIGFDVCLAGMMEVAYEIRNIASYMIASEDLEPGDGWEYHDWLNRFKNSVTKTGADMSIAIVDAYEAKYGPTGESPTATATLSALDLSQIDNVKAKLDDLTYTLGVIMDTTGEKNAVFNILYNYAEWYSSPTLRLFADDPETLDLNLDMWHMAYLLEQTSSYDYAVSQGWMTTTEVSDFVYFLSSESQALRTALDAAVVKEWSNSSGRANSHGLAIHFCRMNTDGSLHITMDNSLSPPDMGPVSYFYWSGNTFIPLQFVQDSNWAPNGSVGTGFLFDLFYQ